MARVLITGATGFIGFHLVRLLAEQNNEVTCLVRRNSDSRRIKEFCPRFLHGDITDLPSLKSAVAGQDFVYHLAGATKWISSDVVKRINVDGCHNVALECSRQSTPPVLILASSLAAAGPSPRDRAATESDPTRPISVYGKSKNEAEKAVARFCKTVPTTILRAPIVFGEGDRDAFEMFKTVANFGIHTVPTLGDKRFSVIHVEDFVFSMELAARRGNRLTPDRSSGIYYVAADESPTYAELGRMIGRELGRSKVTCLKIPKPAVWTLAAACELRSRITRKPFIFGWDKAREATAGSWWCSTKLIREDTGFGPLAPLSQRLEQTAQWYVQQGWIREPTRRKPDSAVSQGLPLEHNRQPQG